MTTIKVLLPTLPTGTRLEIKHGRPFEIAVAESHHTGVEEHCLVEASSSGKELHVALQSISTESWLQDKRTCVVGYGDSKGERELGWG